MSKVLAVFGATGQQGSSVVNNVLNDPGLSQQFQIRAITRDVSSEKSKQLQEKVEVVQGDVADRASIEKALTGVHTVYAMTTPAFTANALEDEFNMAKTIADAAVAQGAQYIIFSTLPSVSEMSGGKITNIIPFEAKAKAEKYIRGLPIKSAFCALGSFMENFANQPFLAPRKAPDDTFVLARHISLKTQWPLIDAVGDTGKFVGAILAEPDKYEGKTFCAATRLYDLEEIIAILSSSTGKTIVYKRISPEEFRESLAMLPPALADILTEGLAYQEKAGYFGPDSENLVAWAAENARGRLSTFEEFLEKHPIQLE